MAFSVNDFRSNLQFGGARPTLFEVQIFNPANSVADSITPFMVEATQIPESRIGDIPVRYFGRAIHFAGDRTFQPWTVRVINDEDYLVRNALENWTNKINTLEGNIRDFSTSSPAEYKSNANVIHYSREGQVLRIYNFVGIFPISVANMELDWNAQDQIMKFSTTFAFDYYTVSGGSTGDAGGSA